jgi:predicted transposase YdaD
VENKKSGLSVRAAVNEAVDWAISENLLDGFFKEQKEEILAMSLTEFNAEKVYRDWLAEGREEGFEQGREEGFEMGLEEGRELGISEGKNEKAQETAVNLLKMKLGAPEQIAKVTNLTLEKVLELQKSIAVEL